MAIANIYLNFNGNCEEAFLFYKSVLGGEFSYLGRYKEMPSQEEMPPLPKEAENLIMHISLPLSKETSIMGSDIYGEWTPVFIEGNNFSICLSPNSKDEANRLFDGLSEGGKIIMPLADTFWGDYYGMFVDKFGINWMISYNEKNEGHSVNE